MTVGYKIEIAESISELTGKMAKDTAQALVGIVETEYVALLHNAPQRSGNYVANMAISAGSRVGFGGPGLYFPVGEWTDTARFARGSTAAITVARHHNQHIKGTLTNHITMGAGGFPPSVTVYNKLEYAGKVDEYSATTRPGILRVPNRPGAHAMTRFSANLQFAMGANLVYGSPKFMQLAKSKII
jgi:hypothetical protein